MVFLNFNISNFHMHVTIFIKMEFFNFKIKFTKIEKDKIKN